MYIYDNISFNSSWNEEVLENLWRKSKHIFYVQNNFTENRAIYEIMWKNMVEPERLQMTIYE